MERRPLLASVAASLHRRARSARTRLAGAAARPAARAPGVIEGLEERVLFALGTSSGGGYSGNLSSNPAIRRQELIADPAEPKSGSTSTTYDPSMVHLAGAIPGPGYATGFCAFVEVRPAGCDKWGHPKATILQPLDAFLKCPAGKETGYVQVQYKLKGTAGLMLPVAGYTSLDLGGVDGVDTHALFFDVLSCVPKTQSIPYTIFAAQLNTHAGNQSDFLVTNDGTNTRLGPGQLSPATVSAPLVAPAQPPHITSTGGPYCIDEGSSLALHGAATDPDTAAGALSYQWDLNGDGTPDATGANPTVSASTLAALGLGDGPKTVNVHLTVGDGTTNVSADTTLTVRNVNPTACVTTTDGVLCGTTTACLTATDPSAADRAAGFKYLVDWGDGTGVQTINATPNNGNAANANHTYTCVGVFNVTVRAVDKDGGTSAPACAPVAVSGAQLRPDPSDPSQKALYVVGTNHDDTIRFIKCGGGLQVLLNGCSLGTFSGFCRVIGFGLGGNDDIKINDAPAVLFGGDGADKLTATGAFNNILVGGEGADTLTSGGGLDVLIGGGGSDALDAGENYDIVVAGITAYDNASDDNVRSLTKILAEWLASDTYDHAVAHLSGAAGGVNGSAVFRTTGPAATVTEDGIADTVKGGGGQDWLIFHKTGATADANDLAVGETGTAI